MKMWPMEIDCPNFHAVDSFGQLLFPSALIRITLRIEADRPETYYVHMRSITQSLTSLPGSLNLLNFHHLIRLTAGGALNAVICPKSDSLKFGDIPHKWTPKNRTSLMGLYIGFLVGKSTVIDFRQTRLKF